MITCREKDARLIGGALARASAWHSKHEMEHGVRANLVGIANFGANQEHLGKLVIVVAHGLAVDGQPRHLCVGTVRGEEETESGKEGDRERK